MEGNCQTLSQQEASQEQQQPQDTIDPAGFKATSLNGGLDAKLDTGSIIQRDKCGAGYLISHITTWLATCIEC